jgi:ubiquinone/menaquinone biosynthesis C-methylase UbiE
MNTSERTRVCSVERAGALDWNLRRLLQNPEKIVKPYIKEGMTVLDLGCGPGFFTLDLAKLVGRTGKVVAADMQKGMLDLVKQKFSGSNLENTIELHQSQQNKIGLLMKFDFILIFYMLHEVPDQSLFLQEVHSFVKPGGRVLIVEPKFHVSKMEFILSVEEMRRASFEIIERPGIVFSRSILLGPSLEENK